MELVLRGTSCSPHHSQMWGPIVPNQSSLQMCLIESAGTPAPLQPYERRHSPFWYFLMALIMCDFSFCRFWRTSVCTWMWTQDCYTHSKPALQMSTVSQWPGCDHHWAMTVCHNHVKALSRVSISHPNNPVKQKLLWPQSEPQRDTIICLRHTASVELRFTPRQSAFLPMTQPATKLHKSCLRQHPILTLIISGQIKYLNHCC